MSYKTGNFLQEKTFYQPSKEFERLQLPNIEFSTAFPSTADFLSTKFAIQLNESLIRSSNVKVS